MVDQNVRILLIEDNPGDARLIKEMLAGAKGAAFDIECTDLLSAGLLRLSQGGVNAILLDLGLPDSQGLETLTRTLTEAKSVPIVVLTGLDDESVGIRAVQVGAQDYLIKGHIDGNLLARTLRYAIERKTSEELLKKYSRELEEKLKLLEEKGISRFESSIKIKNSYILKEKRYDKSIAIFSNLTRFGLSGICLTMTHPDVLKETYDLKNFKGKFLWLSAAGSGEDIVPPSNLTAIHGKVNEFAKKNKNSIVLFLGLENIITLNGFERSLNFINSIIDLIIMNNSRLIIALDPEAMIQRELSLIEKSLIEIKDDDLIRLGLR